MWIRVGDPTRPDGRPKMINLALATEITIECVDVRADLFRLVAYHAAVTDEDGTEFTVIMDKALWGEAEDFYIRLIERLNAVEVMP